MAVAASVVAAVLAVILVVSNLPRGSGVMLDPERVLVAVFENQTGDPSLDPLGAMAGHWITQGLLQSGLVQVVPWLEAQQASRYVASQVDSGNVRSPVTALAEETGAGTVISGAYYRRGETLQYQVEITDVIGGKSLGALDPESAPMTSPDDAIEPLRQRVMGFLAISFDERIADQAGSVAQPPSFEAYRAFDEGVTHYIRQDYPEALSYLSQAFELDTTFVTPLIYATLIHNNRSEWALSDSLVRILGRYRDRLSEYDRHWLDYLKARVNADNPEALRAIRRAAELAPGSKAVYNRAWMALVYNNRPQEAVDALLTLDPERGPMRRWIVYHTALFNSYLKLHEHEKALAVALRAQVMFESIPAGLLWEGLALVGLGRIDEIGGVLDKIRAWPDEGVWQGNQIEWIAVWLRLNGHLDDAQRVIARGIQQYEAMPPEWKSSAGWRYMYAWALYVADRLDDGYSVAKSLSEELPDDLQFRGLVGLFAASRGGRDEALEISGWLGNLDRPYLKGENTWWRSLIAGELGDGENAVRFLRQSVAEGRPIEFLYRPDRIAFESLRGYPPFEELLRPKG